MSEPQRKGMSAKALLILLLVVGGGLALLASVQAWIHVEFFPGVATVEQTEVSGQQASPAITLIALAALAAALVLTIAGPVFRRVIGALVLLLGVGLSSVGLVIALSPIDGARSQVEDATGISGADSHYALVSEISVSAWPMITAAIGVLLAVLGLYVVLFSGRWKAAGRKYDAAGRGKAQKASRPEAQGDRISEWDALSDGDDPTDD